MVTIRSAAALKILGAIEDSADVLTASIAAAARRRFPHDINARAAYFNAAADRYAARLYRPESLLKRAGFTVR